MTSIFQMRWQISENTQKKILFFNALTLPCFARETLRRTLGYADANRCWATPAGQEK